MSKSSVREFASTVLVCGGAALIFAAFGWLVLDVVVQGAGALGTEGFSLLTSSPERAGRDGGIAPILVSTVAVLAICMAVAVPIGVGTAAFLAEFSSRHRGAGRVVRLCLDVLAGVPSIVFGLFGNEFFCRVLGLGYSLLAGGLTLACMVLPILIRSVESGLRAVSDDYRVAGVALAMSRTRLLWSVLLPAAAPAVAVGLVLGIGRALAETAALVFTSGTVDRMPESWLDSGRVLSVHVFELAMNVPGGEARAYTSALVLLVVLFVMNSIGLFAVDRILSRRVFR